MATTKYLSKEGLLYLWTLLKSKLATKVDKIEGKGLSTNDYTVAEKTKLSGIATGANKYIHPDDSNTRHVTDLEKATWNNKADKTAATTAADGLMSAADKTKLNGVATGADVSTIKSVKVNGAVVAPDASKTVNITCPTASDLATKVDKVDGKGLSTNDYTTAEKNKLSGIATGADVSTIKLVKVNGATLAPDASKTVNIEVITPAQVDSKIATAIGGVTAFGYKKVTTLPATGESNFIYLVPRTGVAGNSYDEYAWIDGSWEHFGTTDMELDDYVKIDDLIAVTNSEIDTILAS